MAYEICPRVWFGPAALTYKPLEMLRITHIVNCSGQASATNFWARQDRGFLFLESKDETDFQILDQHLLPLINFVEDALLDTEACVYIHCVMGINRSAALAVAYRCFAQKEAAATVIQQVRAERPGRSFLTNSGFVRQLELTYSLSSSSS
jgi:protein-tyrosine phosphatase